jgi:cytidine deaminase
VYIGKHNQKVSFSLCTERTVVKNINMTQEEKVMKKLIRKISLIMCVVMLTLAVSACGKSNDDTKKEDTKTEDTAKDTTKDDADDADADDEDNSTITGKFKTLEDFVNSDIMQQQLEEQLASLEGSGIALALTAEDNKLIYNFTIEDADLAAALAADPSTLQSSLQSQASTFEAVASSLKAAVEVDNPVVVVRYLDNAGTEIVSQEFAG